MLHNLLLRSFNPHRKELLFLPPVDREYPVPRNPGKRLAVLVVHFVNRFSLRQLFVLLRGFSRFSGLFGHEPAFPQRLFPDPCPLFRVIRKHFGKDIHCHMQRRVRVRDPVLLVHIPLCFLLRIQFCFFKQEIVGKRLQPLLFRDHRTRPSLGTERAVKIFQSSGSHRLPDLFTKLRRKLSLCFDRGQNRLPPFIERAQIPEPLVKSAQLLIAHVAMLLFPVARDERDRIALVDQTDHGLCLLPPQILFLCNDVDNIHAKTFYPITSRSFG